MNYSFLSRLKYGLSLSVVLLLSTAVYAQKTVRGTVKDNFEVPLAGVSVTLKGTSSGTTTNAEGVFTITVPNNASVLVFTFVGTPPREITVGDETDMNVTLELNTGRLNEVVVVGYGTQRRKEVTNAVATVSSEQFNKGNISNVAQLLQGKVAGLSIARPGGNPNGGFTIRLRGLSTLGANTSPLIVVDGQVGADINTVDPNDIASMDVLKDAASAAIYGTRGSSGVIIITTKRGGRTPSLTYSGSITAETPSKFIPHMTAAEFKAAGGNDLGAETDWNDVITRTGLSHVHNLSLSGGGGGTSYIASFNLRNTQGVAIRTGFTQLNGHFGVTQKAIKDKLTITVDGTATRRVSQFGFDRAFQYATIFNPTAPLRTDDPGLNLTGSGYVEQNFVEYANPLAVLEQNTNEGIHKRMNLNVTGTYELIRGLKFGVRYGFQQTSDFRWAYLPKTSFDTRLIAGGSGYTRKGWAQKIDDEGFSQLYENTISYDREIFNELNLSAVAGYSYQDFRFNGMTIRAGDFLTDATAENVFTAGDFKNGRADVSSYKNSSKLVAFFGRINLNYHDWAFLSASLRREGSTQFGVNNKWGMFPAVSVGADLSRITDIPSVNSLKLRASYGVTGALPPQSYLSFLIYSSTGRSFYYNGTYIPSYEPTQNPNPDLKWEVKSELDFGIDFAAFGNRFTGSIDYYNRETSDLVFYARVPVPPNQSDRTWMNIGTLKSSGLEMLLAYDIYKNKDFTWNSSVNFSTYKIKLSKLNRDLAGNYVGASNLGSPGQEATEITRAEEGKEIGLIWGPIYYGVDDDGKYLFADSAGKPISSPTAYQTQIGNGLPNFELGWTNTFTYKNWDLNIFLRGSFGHDLVNTYRAFWENATPTVVASYNIVKTKYFNPNLTAGQTFSSLFVERASFVKLDNLSLGYNFNFKNSSAVKGLRAYINAQNLFVITDYTGVDPEVRFSYGGNILAPGVDARDTYVLTRQFTFGVNVRF
jgi:TonB-dependent starch-binding outer membrane protein SusC